MASTQSLAKQLLGILKKDRERLLVIDEYLQGEHDDPYMPPQATDEYRLLAKRAVSNWMPLLVGTPAQALYVDGFRRGAETPGAEPANSLEWSHWQRSRMDARQAAIYRGALSYGHAFTVTEMVKDQVVTKGLSALRTVALFEDPANDHTPHVALTVTDFGNKSKEERGTARMWDAESEYEVTFLGLEDEKPRVKPKKRHGASECPVTRFAAAVDLEGRTVGCIEPMIPLQNRINQTVFDLLVAQTYGSFKVRWVTGMAPPMLTEPVNEAGDVVGPNDDPDTIVGQRVKVGKDGKPIPAPINHNASRFLFADDPDVHFGSLDETPLSGFIDSIDMSIRHFSAVGQIPPHHMLGQIANLSAEALLAAETALARKIAEFRVSFGESWERVFRLAAELNDDSVAASDFGGEVIWRDMESRSLAQAADALGKLREQLGIPAEGLWHRVPDATQAEIARWKELSEQGDSVGLLADALRRSAPPASEPVVSEAA